MDKYRAGSYPLEAGAGYSQNRWTGFNSIQQDLQKQTSHLLNERQNIETRNPYYNSSQQTIIDKAYISSPDKRNRQSHKSNRKGLIKSKIEEIMGLCQNENRSIDNQFNAVLNKEKQVLNLLVRPQNKQTNNNLNLISEVEQFEGDQNRQTTFGPIINKNKLAIQIKDKNNSKNKSKNYQKSAIDVLKTQRNQQQTSDPEFGSGNIRQKLRGHTTFDQNAFQMVEALQRKAIEQIQALRHDKIYLLKRINKQIKEHNQQKKLRLQFQAQVKRLRSILAGFGYFEEQWQHDLPLQNISNQPGHIKHQSPQNIQERPMSPKNRSRSHKNQKRNKSKSKSKKHKSRPRIQTKFSDDFAPNINGQRFTHPYPQVQSPLQYKPQAYQHLNDLENEARIQNKVKQLEQQNYLLKRSIAQAQAPGSSINKSQLRNQMNSLRARLKGYEQEIHKLKGLQLRGNREFEELYMQGQAIKGQTIRLLKKAGVNISNNVDFNQIRIKLNEHGISPQISRQISEYKNKLQKLRNENSKFKSHINRSNQRWQNKYSKPIPQQRRYQSNSMNSDRAFEFQTVLGNDRY